jgi:mono/diheme cytochrome c family protein
MKKTFILFVVFLAAVASCSKKSVPATATTAINPVTIFGKKCSGCHGSDGTNGKSPNLARSPLDKAGLVQIITKGHGHMPAFEDVLSQQEIAALGDWVLALKK